MKVLHLSTSDSVGGAAIAAYRLNEAINKKSSHIQSKMFVIYKDTDDINVLESSNKFLKIYTTFKNIISSKIQSIQFKKNLVLHSLSLMPSSLSGFINKSDFDVINIHWIQGEMMSIEDIGNIKKPIVWTLHDAWPFSGSEHFQENENDIRYINGYLSKNKLNGTRGLDLDKLTWLRKKKHFPKSIVIACPSKWLSSCAKKSIIFKENVIKTIPNTLPTDIFKPYSKEVARKLFNLPSKSKLILFGALSGNKEYRKGWDLLERALRSFSNDSNLVEAVIFGQSSPKIPPDIKMPIHFIGKLRDKESIAMLYSAVDVMIVPSRVENLPQTATEAQCCGIPVVGFNTCGMKDVIDHKRTGYLCKPFSISDLKFGIKWILDDKNRRLMMCAKSRERALKLWEESKIVKKYSELYKSFFDK